MILSLNLDQILLPLALIHALLLDDAGVVQTWLGSLHDVGHFFEKNSVFSLDLSVSALKHSVLLGISHGYWDLVWSFVGLASNC